MMSGAWGSGQGSIFTYNKFVGSKFESRRSHTLNLFIFFFLVCYHFPLLLVSLYSIFTADPLKFREDFAITYFRTVVSFIPG